MTLLWIADVLLLFVVIPAVLVVLVNVMEPIRQIKHYADDIAYHGALFGPHLESLQHLGTTRQLVKEIVPELQRYCAALDRIR